MSDLAEIERRLNDHDIPIKATVIGAYPMTHDPDVLVVQVILEATDE